MKTAKRPQREREEEQQEPKQQKKGEGGSRKAKRKKEGKTISIAPTLWNSLEDLGREFKLGDPRGDHSKLISEMVSAAVTKWKESPYVCRSAQYVVFVTKDGHVFYRHVQELKLNSDRKKLPCVLEMKPEKRQEFLREGRTSGNEGTEWLKSRWLLNHFAVWHGHERAEFKDAYVDRDGTDVKIADLEVNLGAGAVLTREIIAGIQKYVQWQDSDYGDDRVDFPIDIPTRNLEVVVIVDLDLYRATKLELEEIHDLKMEFRNREAARFEGEGVARDNANPMGDPLVGRHLADAPHPRADEVLTHLSELEQRVEELRNAKVKDGAVVDQPDALINAFHKPENFLFYKREWSSPYFGLTVCVRWAKPARLE